MARWIVIVISLAIVALFVAGNAARAQTGDTSFLDRVASLVAENITKEIIGEDVFGGLGGIKADPFVLTTRDSGSGPATTTEQFGSILPAENNSFNLGIYARSWRDLYVSGTIFSGGTIGGAATTTFSNNMAVQGNTRLGDATSDLIQISGRISTGLSPNVNDSLDIGAYTLAWNDIYSSGTVFADTMVLAGTGTSTYAGNLEVLGNTRLGDSTADLIDLTGRISTSILPNVNNTLDIGAFGNAWRNQIVSGTVTSSQFHTVGNGLFTRILTEPGATRMEASAGNLIFNTPGTILFQDSGTTVLQISDPGTRAQILAASTYYVQIGDAGTTSRSLNANDDVFIANRLEVDGTVFLEAGASSTWHINPTANNSYDLGAFGTAWRDIYTSGTIFSGGTIGGAVTTTFSNNLAVAGNTRLGDATSDLIDLTGRISTTVNPNVNNTLDIGAFGNAWRNIIASGTLAVSGDVELGNETTDTINTFGRFGTNLVPSSNNASDLGAYGNAWNELYASGTAFADSLVLTGTIRSSRTTDLGWSVVNAANQACNTTCTNACVVGLDTAVLGNFLACTDVTADTCLCAGSN